MTQTELNREVARATGESVDRVEKLGFNLTIVPAFRKLTRPTSRPTFARLRPHNWRAAKQASA